MLVPQNEHSRSVAGFSVWKTGMQSVGQLHYAELGGERWFHSGILMDQVAQS